MDEGGKGKGVEQDKEEAAPKAPAAAEDSKVYNSVSDQDKVGLFTCVTYPREGGALALCGHGRQGPRWCEQQQQQQQLRA